MCLGLQNKKGIVTDFLCANNVSICGLQETEIPINFPGQILSCGGYTLELEANTKKKRAGFYSSTDILYERSSDLEKENVHVVIIDFKVDVLLRVINVY